MRALNRRTFLLNALTAGGAVLVAGGAAGMVASAAAAGDAERREREERILRRWCDLSPFDQKRVYVVASVLAGLDYSDLVSDPAAIAQGLHDAENLKQGRPLSPVGGGHDEG